ncbi:Small glutamine-rich tetratricopeptide repeat-containing protein beta [Mycena sanguinolenta]|uniref:Small glutamine-rich tetratricopeptide repeat-containing protein beta n=1 Tax=Mycena sanguinolenta TaxID=230812 RepID=A0A8H6XBI0_9AGAR|nr:Small glutamine-rich tetratricopeptide repeat-containing protein beta [Mycena sanguinolenta]
MSTNFERLKAEANTLHGQGSYQAAYQKYSEAIKENPDDAVLAIVYANRAASCIAMKEYLDAMHDGVQATKLDPRYAKAWARVGTAARALELWDQSRTAWKSALSCLPVTGLTPAEVALKTQFEAELEAVDAGESKAIARERSGKNTSDIAAQIDNMPWNRALALAQEGKLDFSSSGWVILNAYRDFTCGIQAMQSMVVKRQGQKTVVKASPSALVDMTNGILRDHRVFHADSDFFEQLQNQMRFEVESTNAWAGGGPKQIQQELPQRLRKLGWLPVRRALSVTVRLWIMRGFLDSNMGVLEGGVEFYKRTLDVLEWGRRTYPNVPLKDRGVIFEDSFKRGVERLYIPAVVSLYLKRGDACGYSLDDIARMARDLKTETEASELTPECAGDSGFHGSFWIYPIAEALSFLGWYHMQLGLRCIDAQKDLDPEAAADFSKSANYYIQAAEKFPMDEGEHPHLLAVALEALWWSGATLEDTLPLCRKIRTVMPQAAMIWEFSPSWKKQRCQDAINFLAEAERQLAEGTWSLDDAAMPSDMGLGAWEKCFAAWDSALACIPSQDLTAAQKALQAQLQDGIKASKAAKARPPPPSRLVAVPTGRNGNTKKMPWARAAALEKKILASQKDSSAIVILYASRTFERGVKSMKGTVKRYIKGELAVEGVPNAIEFMSSGILIDRRCFYMDSRDWLNQFMEQLKFEGEYYQAWSKAGSKIVIEQVPTRLQKEGWSSVLTASETLDNAGLLAGSNGRHGVATEHFRNTVDLIEWGRDTWKDVSRSLRGDIFDLLFLRSVRRLFVASVMDWVEANDPGCDYTPQNVAKFAQDMIKELSQNTPEKTNEDQYHPNHPGHYAAAWTYTHADALGVLGWFHLRLSKTAKTAEDENIHLAAAARNYMEAAETYPDDDEFSVSEFSETTCAIIDLFVAGTVQVHRVGCITASGSTFTQNSASL